MNITKDDIEKVISQIEASSYREAYYMLKELIEEKLWEPKELQRGCMFFIGYDGHIYGDEPPRNNPRRYGNEWPTEDLARTARDMNKRNQLILQAKTDIGAKDGRYGIEWQDGGERWEALECACRANPELTFETLDQAEQVIKMLRLNEK